MHVDLKDQRALIGGASQGIGQAIAHAFAEAGARVTVLARTEDKLRSVLDALPGEGHTMVVHDMADREGLFAQVERSIQTGGGYDILVCNTGGPKGGPITLAEEAEFLRGFENHVLVNHGLSRLCLEHMKSKKSGRIINVISTSVKVPIPNLGVSNTIRGAVANWSKTMANELAPLGITVNNILPGLTDTPRLETLMQADQARTGASWSETLAAWKQKVPMRRFADPKETAALAVFLASNQASYITGVNIPVDGGRTGCL